MQRLTIVITALLAFSCAAPESTQKVDTRDAIALYYVTAPELKVHATPSDQAEVVTRFLNGESAAVLSRRNDDWVEVRTANGSGWAHMSELGSAGQAQQSAENPTPRFEKVPAPVTSPSTHGTIYIEANVNTDGQVTSAKIITNTTGSDELGQRNVQALEQSRFYPIVIKGEKKPFVYYYRVDY